VNGDYLGFGVGAHSHRRNRRWWNVRDLHAYLQRAPSGSAEADDETIDAATAMAETMLLGTRLAEGIANDAFFLRHGRTIDATFGPTLTEYATQGLVRRIGGRTALTPRGRLVADALAVRFVVGGE
jgi:oxygen-independent coproporphyrinogen-3 oxidase